MKVLFYDIETFLEYFLVCVYELDTGEKHEFRINRWQNNLYSFIKYMKSHKEYYWVGYNNISFDGQVLEYINRNYEEWAEVPRLEICSLIGEAAQDAIQRQQYRLPLRYWEDELDFKQIDLQRMHHFDNEKKRVSLKWLEFMMEMPNVEVTPIDFRKVGLTEDDIEIVTQYCWNDIDALLYLWKYTTGDVENEEYKGKNKIIDRMSIIQKFEFPERAISWSDVKIGEEINMVGYMKKTGRTRKDIYAAKKARKYKKITFGQCIPDYVEFQTTEFQEFKDRMSPVKIDFYKKIPYPFSYNGTKYIIGKGGLHSVDKKRLLYPKAGEYLEDADVGSQYPNAIFKRNLYPVHLGKEWLVNYEISIREKDKYKQLAKAGDKAAKGIEESYKLALNGGGYGKTGEPNSWQYGPEVMYACTVGNQFEILMLIERHELTGIRVISANTDGIVCLYPKHLEEIYKRNCTWWEEKVGNLTMGKLEYTKFKKVYQSSVSDYLAIKEDGKIKKKGDFVTDHILSKNKSRRIVPIALEKYVVDGTPVEETIRNHKHIFDFLIGVKASGNYHYEATDRETGDVEEFRSLLVYYVSTNGRKLLKIKNEDSEATGNAITNCEAPDEDDDHVWLCTPANKIDPTIPIENYNIDYTYYEKKCYRIIESVEGKKGKIVNKNQISLF